MTKQDSFLLSINEIDFRILQNGDIRFQNKNINVFLSRCDAKTNKDISYINLKVTYFYHISILSLVSTSDPVKKPVLYHEIINFYLFYREMPAYYWLQLVNEWILLQN